MDDVVGMEDTIRQSGEGWASIQSIYGAPPGVNLLALPRLQHCVGERGGEVC